MKTSVKDFSLAVGP